jgi:hypothetical protein
MGLWSVSFITTGGPKLAFALGASVLLVTGAVGVGKTTVGYEVRLRLAAAGVRHVMIDDEFSLFHPHANDDPKGERLRTQALRSLWSVYEGAGFSRLLLTRVIEWDADLDRVRAAIPDSEIHMFWLVAPFETLAERIRGKGVSTAQEWCLQRAAELVKIWTNRPPEATRIETMGRDPRDIGSEIVAKSGWLSSA